MARDVHAARMIPRATPQRSDAPEAQAPATEKSSRGCTCAEAPPWRPSMRGTSASAPLLGWATGWEAMRAPPARCAVHSSASSSSLSVICGGCKEAEKAVC